jgi:hypothetical protein
MHFDYNFIINFVANNIEYFKYALLIICILFLSLRICFKKRNKKLFYNTGFKLIFSAWDRIKLKIRLGDYDDTKGIRYCYFIAIKLFAWEFYRVKYIDQKGKIYKRNLRFGGVK